MPLDKARTYCSYLLRCWVSQEAATDGGASGRFVVERVSGEAQRRGFNTFEELVAFLRVELLERIATQPDSDRSKG